MVLSSTSLPVLLSFRSIRAITLLPRNTNHNRRRRRARNDHTKRLWWLHILHLKESCLCNQPNRQIKRREREKRQVNRGKRWRWRAYRHNKSDPNIYMYSFLRFVSFICVFGYDDMLSHAKCRSRARILAQRALARSNRSARSNSSNDQRCIMLLINVASHRKASFFNVHWEIKLTKRKRERERRIHEHRSHSLSLCMCDTSSSPSM